MTASDWSSVIIALLRPSEHVRVVLEPNHVHIAFHAYESIYPRATREVCSDVRMLHLACVRGHGTSEEAYIVVADPSRIVSVEPRREKRPIAVSPTQSDDDVQRHATPHTTEGDAA